MTCPLCGSSEGKSIQTAFRDLVKCRCEFIYYVGKAQPADPQLYDSQWSKDELHPTYMYNNGSYVIRNEQNLTDLLNRVEPYRKLNRFLDVGCSAAFFLQLAKKKGWDVQGVEVSDFGVKFSREVLGINVFQGMLEAAHFPAESFDAVHSSHVIEHVARPSDLVKEMHRILRPGGVLIAVIPTQFSDPSYRLFGKVHGEGPPRHVSYFSKSTFERLLKNQGFQVAYSSQNVELRRLIPGGVTKEAPRPVSAMPARHSEEPVKRKDGTAHNPIIRSIKQGINRLGTLVGVGDELTTIAVKA